ncbi:M28 family peptidase [Panacibacter ginsenosidivorans]|uniref:M28 family peptidase n=1 Tax=Panacibacter ginsenosidivorans TaxID=1813871 RepID=A0A5B8VA96_9BACT|nr:M28 family peptidase [Panacibacter ginsenosidivorans]QEC68045.1 M28 family peptidase [Panacibacter ginsenosidivorans]
MKKLLLLIVLFPLLTFAQTKKQRKAQEKADKITITNIQAHIKYLADDKLEGRRTGTPGETLAMQYIVDQFNKNGLQPKGTNGFVQEFEINEGKQFEDSGNEFSINDTKLELKKDYFPLAFSANKTVTGIASPGLREKDEPWFYDVKDVLAENKSNPHFDIYDAIIKEATNTGKKGGTALIVYNSSSAVDNIQFNKNDSTALADIPVVFVTGDAAKKFLDDSTGTYDLGIKVSLTHKTRKAHNVVGYLNFNAPTTVIIGAHYDHLGYGEDANSLDGQGQIHNGADDNASGTAALIEMSRVLQKTKAHNNNYLFIAFSGEELGLFGSKYWLDKPTMNIVPNYMINMDMVGRYADDRKLTIGGYGTSPEWGQVFATATDKRLAIKFDSSGSGPSDHASFYRKEIPVLFFFTNSHPDYHKATDDWDKINYAGEVEIVDYINQIIEATDTKGKLTFTKTRDAEIRSVSLPVTLGVMPDYGYSGTGMRIDGVSKGKTAERIGLQAGDILLQLGDYKFVDVTTYMQALQHFKKGDKTKLHIKRADKEIDFDVEF